MQKFDFKVLQAAIDAAVSVPVDKIIEDVQRSEFTKVIHAIDDTIDSEQNPVVVIDIRRPNEVTAEPLALRHVLTIPFYELKTAFKTLNPSVRYALYCDKGVMSQLHAQYLIELGFDNVLVYRPLV
ncbi:thiazole biosynthesis protein [Thiomicrorhabdus aquaedulcis]|uniref:thiazole biosynthesis protein n=1 Tax=Thiomicrorhabdus aquaedulcis TaxID=2211106 RepID=UPI001E5A6B19|nr:thiazole biosynthesis protein [Thiomicrorhabdus aquaedulcis]